MRWEIHLLSLINPAEESKESFEETFDRQNAEQTNTEETTTDDYDWEYLSEPEEEDISVGATRHVSSFAETVSTNERVIELKAALEAEFPVGKTFADKDIARLEMQSFSKANNIPFETFKSDKSYIKMIFKHFDKYRAAKKGEDEEDIGTGEGLEVLRNDPIEPLEEQGARHSYMFLNSEDQELAISLMRAGTTPSETLKCVVIDATYKNNSHKMVLLNFVVAGTLRSKEKPKQLVTVPIAGCWMDRETGDRYRWSMNCFREILWPVGESTGNLPKCFVTDNDEALLGAIKSVFPERNLMEMEVKSFMAIIKQMALTCATKSEFLVAKDAYEAFVSTKGMCVKGGAQTMIKYLHHMMVKKQFWVGYYVNNLMHMGNRTSNRVESTHANIKRSNNTSSGSMAVVTEKIDLWIKKREDYRNLQSIKESVSQRPVFLEHDIADQLSLIRLNVSSFAFESIKNELIEMKASEENPNHVSHVRSGENCLFATVAEVSAELGKDSAPESGSQQESVDLLKDMDALILKYSTDRLDTALAPEIVEIQKGRPKGTKRNKLGVEHEDEKICIEQKNSKKIKQEQKKVENDKSQKNKPSLRKPSTTAVNKLKSKYKPSEVVTRNSDNSNLFKMLDSQYADDVLGLVNPIPNGNCGIRAVSAAVFGHEEAWIQVKKMMLATFQ
ncbi:hypothetical protein INT47_007433, partial [Mucor saturninus]